MPETLERKAVQHQLEEDIEYSNVTSFRAFFLKAVEVLRRNPAKRYLITKGGEPQAVLMSFGTYSLMKKVVDRMLAQTSTPNSAEAIKASFARLREDWERQQRNEREGAASSGHQRAQAR